MQTSTHTHTPGPWTVVGPIRTGTLGGADWQHAGFGVRAAEPKQFGGTDIVDKGLHEADARLIAAAPALLDALRTLVYEYEVTATSEAKQGYTAGLDRIDEARAAIAAATGEDV